MLLLYDYGRRIVFITKFIFYGKLAKVAFAYIFCANLFMLCYLDYVGDLKNGGFAYINRL